MRRLNEYIGKSVKVLSTETKTYIQKGVIGKSGVVFQVKNGSNKIGVLIEHNKNKEIFWFSENELEINNRYDRNEFCKVAIIEMFKGEEIGVAINSEFYYQLKEFYQKHDKVLCDDVIIMFERFGYRVCNHLGFLKGIVDVNYYDKKIEGNAIRITLEEISRMIYAMYRISMTIRMNLNFMKKIVHLMGLYLHINSFWKTVIKINLKII